jgi:uncharacterized membrane protein
MSETSNRLFKVICWRVVSIFITLVLMLIFTGDVREASSITFILHAFLTMFHYLFETLWEKISKSI